jgi:hypothetical protein
MITDFDTSTWSDPWFRRLSLQAKTLFIYLWTNEHKNLAGLYILDLDVIAFETGIAIDQVTTILDGELSQKIKYDYDTNLVWVVNNVKRQFIRSAEKKISDKIVTAISKALLSLPENHSFINQFLEKYASLSIPYSRSVDRVSGYPTGKGKGKGLEVEVKKEGVQGEKTKRKSAAPVSLDLTGDQIAWAIAEGLPENLVAAETTRYLDHFRSKGELRLDWLAGWRNWIRTAVQMRAERGLKRSGPEGKGGKYAGIIGETFHAGAD